MSLTKATNSMIQGAPANVLDYGADPTGATDSTAAIQAALNSGAMKVIFPHGEYLCDGSLTLPAWVELEGMGFPLGIGVGSSSTPVLITSTLTSGTFITASSVPVIKNIYFKGAGSFDETTHAFTGSTAVCIQTGGNIVIDHCCFALWYKAIQFAGNYYLRFDNIEFNRCDTGYTSTGGTPYNVTINSPVSRLTRLFYYGSGSDRNIKVIGGSVESYSSVASNFAEISFFGTYFETDSVRAGCFAIDPNGNGKGVTLVGCLIYLNYTARFVNMSGRTGCQLTSVGNVFAGNAPSPSIIFYLPDTGDVSISGTRIQSGQPADATLVQNVTAARQYNVQFPTIESGNTLETFSGIQTVGGRGIVMTLLTAEPSNKVTGMLVSCDGTSWDPLSKAYGRPYWVVWQGDRWYAAGG